MKQMEDNEIIVHAGSQELHGILVIPPDADSLVIFSHGSGSSRFSKRNNYVAGLLNKQKMATLLIDLLTEKEDTEFENRFDIDLLTERLTEITLYMRELQETRNLKTVYFGASTGAASALGSAARLGTLIKAVVSRGGRPDLAAHALEKVKSPTLLLIGSLDTEVIKLNEHAYEMLTCEKKIEIIKGATHLFEEPGKLDEVATLAANWFRKHIHSTEIKEHAI